MNNKESKLSGSDKSKLYWQCRRGMLELDLMLQAFFESRIDNLDESELAAFRVLLDCADDQLLEYLMGRVIPTDPAIANVVNQVRHATNQT